MVKKINYKIWLALLAFLGIHIYFLIQSAQDYKTAGKMIKEILNCAKTSKINVQKLYVVNVPAQLRGALMFRNSFGPALKLFAPNLQFKELQVIQSVILQKGYKIECKKIAYQDMEGRLNQFGIYFNSQKDLAIWFTKEDVYFIR